MIEFYQFHSFAPDNFYEIGESAYNLNFSIFTTEDGSHSIINDKFNEAYHSKFGAVNESLHIYIGAGLNAAMKVPGDMFILDVGFGAGLNAWLTLNRSLHLKRKIFYLAVEPFPVPKAVYEELNYTSSQFSKTDASSFLFLHESAWEREHKINDYFYFFKTKEKIGQTTLPAERCNLVYFDAFSPLVQPELWSVNIFNKINRTMINGGILVTYSCRGLVKNNLSKAGFKLEKLPGPAGKKEILRAIKESGQMDYRTISNEV